MTNEERQKLDIEMDMIRGNLNRMCVTDDFDELFKMHEVAERRLFNIYNMNVGRIREVTADDK